MGAQEVLVVLREALDLLTDEASGCTPPLDHGCALDPLPCRTAIYPGFEVAWDTCEQTCGEGNGQLWANISSMDVRQDPPCEHITFTAEIGVIRCAASLGEDGSIPSEEAVAADADQQAADADAIYKVLTCCEARSESLRGIVTVSWRALGPEGKCVGGVWVVRGIIVTCC